VVAVAFVRSISAFDDVRQVKAFAGPAVEVCARHEPPTVNPAKTDTIGSNDDRANVDALVATSVLPVTVNR
jgi:hypothetical protein